MSGRCTYIGAFMLRAFPGYQVLELRVSTGTSCYWRARRNEDGEMVLIKSRRMGSTQHKAHALSLELCRLDDLESPYLPKILDSGLEHPDPFLVLEALPEHDSITHRSAIEPLSSAQTTEVGIHMTRALMTIHRQGLCCLSLSPDAIWIDPSFSRCVLMDLGNATQVGNFTPEVAGCCELDSGLQYIAPEQTGRLYEALDERSDFYTLGLVLHSALRGKFTYSHHRAPHSLIYAQLCEPPPELPRNGIAPALRGIIAKLSEKSKRRRYQSTNGLLFDLKKTRKEIAFNRNLDFPAGLRDRPLRFDPSPILYEREDALSNLRSAIDRCARGQAGYVSLEGAAGVGKSRLLASVMPDLARHQMLFAKGRCLDGIQGQNYGPIAEILRSLIAAAHALPPHLRREQKQRCHRAVGGHSALLRDIIPEIDGFLPNSNEPLGEFLPQERQRACLLAMLRFILSFACHHQPLVLHFDNLQWAEFKTTSMIHALLADPQSRYLLIIGSVRRDAKPRETPSWEQGLIKSGVPFTPIELKPLSEAATTAFVTDSLSKHPSVKALAKRLHAITAGKPDALGEHLLFLHSQSQFFYDDKERCWKAKNQILEQLLESKGSSDILAQRFAQLSEHLGNTLITCALLGDEVRQSRVSIALGLPAHQARSRLDKLTKHGFLNVALRPWRANVSTFDPNGEVVVYRFAKNQMREHLLGLSQTASRLRSKICIPLLQEPALEQSAELRRKVVSLAYPALKDLAQSGQSQALKKLFFQEAMEAYACTAYDRAQQLSQGYTRLLNQKLDCKTTEYWQLNIRRLSALHITKDDQAYAELLHRLQAQSTTKERKSELLHAKIIRAVACAQSQLALGLLVEFAELVDQPISLRPASITTKARVTRWHLWLNQKRVDQLFAGPALRSPLLLRFLDALTMCTKCAFTTNQPNLYIAIIHKGLEITFQKGLCAASSAFFSHVALMYLSKSSDGKAAERLFAWASQILQVLPHRHYQASIVFLGALYRSVRNEGLAGCRSELMRAHRLAHEAGDEWTATHCLSQATSLSFWLGDPLPSVYDRAGSAFRYASQTQIDQVASVLEGVRYNIDRLRNPALVAKSVGVFSDTQSASFSNRATCLGYDLAFAVHLGDYPNAWEHCRKLDMYAPNIEGLVLELMVSFYRGVVACYFLRDEQKKSYAASNLEDARKRLARWERRSPQTASHFVLLLNAIYDGESAIHVYEPDPEKLESALRALDYAIFEAESLSQYNLAALACTWGLRWSHRLDLSSRISLYATRIQYYREKWGTSLSMPGDPLQINLCRMNPAPSTGSRGMNPTPKTATIADPQNVAYDLVMQSCSLASRKREPQEVLRDFMELVLGLVPTERIVVALNANLDIGQGSLFSGTKGLVQVAQVRRAINATKYQFEQRELLSDELPTGLIYHCAQAQETIVVDCVQESSLVAQDPYFRIHRPSSALLVSIPGSAKAIGVVYLENQSGSHAVAQEHLRSIRLLAHALGARLLGQSTELRQRKQIEDLQAKLLEAQSNTELVSRDRQRLSSLLLSAQQQLRAGLDAIQTSIHHTADPDAPLRADVQRMQETVLALEEITQSRHAVRPKALKPFGLRGLLDTLCAKAQAMARQNGTPLRITNALTQSNLQVLGDRNLCLRAVKPLLEFAIQLSGERPVEIRMELRQDPQEPQFSWVTALDLVGQNESPEARMELFDLPSQPVSETGLGGHLFRARQRLHFLGGHMEVEPGEQGMRLRSVIELELHQPRLQQAPLRLLPKISARPPHRALVALESTLDARVMRQLLELHGLEAWVASNGLEAVQRFEAEPQGFRLVILGCSLAMMDGYQAAAHIRAKLHTNAGYVPIFGLSPQGDHEERDRCLASGMDLHLQQPVPVETLAKALERWGIIEAPSDLSIAA